MTLTALVSFLWIGAIDFPKGVGAVGMVVGTRTVVLRLQPGRDVSWQLLQNDHFPPR